MSDEQISKAELLDKPVKNLTRQEVEALYMPIGTPEMPYPMSYLVENETTGYEVKVGMISSASGDYMRIPTALPQDFVYGRLLREAPTPQMMFLLREILSRLSPKSDNSLIAVFGDPESGKTHALNLVAELVHPKGAMKIDCGGLNMRELIWRTVIDYGQGVQEALEKKAAAGKLNQSTIDALQTGFPGSITVMTDGKVTINWQEIGKTRALTDKEIAEYNSKGMRQLDGDILRHETPEMAVARARRLLEDIYTIENISFQKNAFGLKTVPGMLFESFESGQPFIGDEVNKSQRGTLDMYHGLLEVFNGNDPGRVIRFYNPMPTTGSDTPEYIEFDMRKKKPGWFCAFAGNDPKDGNTTHLMSDSFVTRLNLIRIGEASEYDWQHRLSQFYTGLPLTTLYDLYKTTAEHAPEEFAEYLLDKRTAGLTAAEVNAIPPNQINFLLDFPNTVLAIQALAKGYYEQKQLSNPASGLSSREEYANCSEELALNAKNIHVGFRAAQHEAKKALESIPAAVAGGALPLPKKVKDAIAEQNKTGLGKRRTPGWHTMGANLIEIRKMAIANACVGMPNTCNALVNLWKLCGVFPNVLQQGQASAEAKDLSQLLRYNPLKDIGVDNLEEVSATRDALTTGLRAFNPGIDAEDEDLIPMRNLALLMQEFNQKSRPPKSILLPNTDITTATVAPLVEGLAMPTYAGVQPEGYKLVDFREALMAIASPALAAGNAQSIAHDKEQLAADFEKSGLDVNSFYYQLVSGEHKLGVEMGILVAENPETQKECYLYTVRDKVRDKCLVVGPADIPSALQSVVANTNVEYISQQDPGCRKAVGIFFDKAIRDRALKNAMIGIDPDMVNDELRVTFTTISRVPEEFLTEQVDPENADVKVKAIKPNVSFGDLLEKTTQAPYVALRLLKRVP